ncbi:MAG: ethanolamine utilization protein EutH [Victivallales bacterium]|nr:ethanolamine utilization protein EutH [Victivallales bacterium]
MPTFSQIMSYIMAAFLVVGIIDHFNHDKWGLGKKMDTALGTFPILFVVMGGIVAIIPSLTRMLEPAANILCKPLGIDPGVLPGIILANDNGGYQLAKSMCQDQRAGELGGMVIASLIGATLSGNIAPAIMLTNSKEHPYIVRGFIYGFLVTPIGAFAGGLLLHMPLLYLLRQLLPLFVASMLLAFAFAKYTDIVVKATIWLGKALGVLAYVGISASIFVFLIGFEQKCSGYITPVTEIIKLIGMIVITLMGAYVMAEVVSKAFRKPLSLLGNKLGCNDVAMSGIVISLANAFPTFSMTKDMNPKGKVIAYAFIFGASYALGDHLAFCSSAAPNLMPAMFTAKFTTAILATALATTFKDK